jgi:hypothetical protein
MCSPNPECKADKTEVQSLFLAPQLVSRVRSGINCGTQLCRRTRPIKILGSAGVVSPHGWLQFIRLGLWDALGHGATTKLSYRNATLCEVRERWCAHTIVLDRSNPGSVPILRHLTARIKRDLQAEVTTFRSPRGRGLPGALFCGDKVQTDIFVSLLLRGNRSLKNH